MRILLTNDDGVGADGLNVLHEIALTLSDDVWVVAPETDQSGASHSLTLKDPMRRRQIKPKYFSVDGTPTDCVIMAVRRLLTEKQPDLILSGINHGQNLADDVTYSGTIAGAIEGTLLGIPSIALSLTRGMREVGSICWELPRQMGAEVIKDLISLDWPRQVFMNINFPDCEPEDVKGMKITHQGQRDQNLLNIDERQDPQGRPYYWFNFERKKSNPKEGTDLWAIYNNYISITPLHLDLTHHDVKNHLEQKFSSSKSP